MVKEERQPMLLYIALYILMATDFKRWPKQIPAGASLQPGPARSPGGRSSSSHQAALRSHRSPEQRQAAAQQTATLIK